MENTDYNGISDDSVTKNTRTSENTRKIATSQRDDCTTHCLLEHLSFKANNEHLMNQKISSM